MFKERMNVYLIYLHKLLNITSEWEWALNSCHVWNLKGNINKQCYGVFVSKQASLDGEYDGYNNNNDCVNDLQIQIWKKLIVSFNGKYYNNEVICNKM